MNLTKSEKLSKKAIVKLIIKLYFALFLVLILAWGFILGINVLRLYLLAYNVKTVPSQVDAQQVIPMVHEAADDIEAIYEQTRPLFPILNAMQGLPLVGKYLGQAEPLLTYAETMATAGDECVSGLEPLLNGKLSSQVELSLSERASQVLEAGQVNFKQANAALEQAAAVRSRIRPDLLPNSVKPWFSLVDDRFDQLVGGVHLLQAAPVLLGADQTQNYLVLAQNRDELRATGGFISGIGLLSIRSGKIQQFTLGDSYAIDDFTKTYPAPPEALKRFMLADYWVTRDANWSPDFPTAAQQAQALYTLSTGLDTQGVIAFNQLAVAAVLQVIGPVQVAETDEAITSENVVNYMRQSWAPEPAEGLSEEWWLHRKDFMQLLGNAILEKVLASSEPGQLLSLVKVFADLMDQGQVLLYFNNTTAQTALEGSGWDGAIHPGEADYLYLVDSNVGFNKVDSVIKRTLAYQIDLRDLDHPIGTVTLTYQQTGSGNSPCIQVASYGTGTYQEMQERCYWDYWRIYTPAGTGLLSTTAQPVSADELLNGEGWSGQVTSMNGEDNTQVFAGLLVLPIGRSTQFEISYALPTSIFQRSADQQYIYSLRIDKQPGLESLPFSLEIVLPPTLHIISSSEAMQPANTNSWIWKGVLAKSSDLVIGLSSQP
jgi:hypothetical protein